MILAQKFEDEFDMEFDDIEEEADVIKLYKQGWSIVEIAQSKDYKISDVLRLVKRGVKNPRQQDIEEAEKYIAFENETDFYTTIRRIK